MRNTTGYRKIAAAFYNAPLAILPSKLAEVRAFLELKFSGGDVSAKDVRRIVSGRRKPNLGAYDDDDDGGPRIVAGRRPGANVQMAGRVAVIPVIGLISARGGAIDDSSTPCVSCADIGAALDALVSDKSCKAICMVFDSPGGAVGGVPELADKIRALRSEKKIVGFVDGIAASAGYWLASQCTSISCCPSGQVGSIGVLAAHEDHSAEAEAAGVKTTLITSSKFKGEGSPFSPLDAEARAEIQRVCNAYHAMFIGAIARGRGVSESRVEKDFGQGRMALAIDARSAGMIDKIQVFSQLLKDLGSDAGSLGSGDGGYGASSKDRDRVTAQEARARVREIERELSRDSRADRRQGGAGGASGDGRERWTREAALRRAREIAAECELN